MPFPISQAVEVRPFRAERLKDGRKRITRFVSWKQNNELPVQMSWEYGHDDIFANAPTGWTGLYLTNAETDYSIANNGAGNDPVVVLTFEQISKTNDVLTQVGDTAYNYTETGLKQTIIDYAQFDTATYTPGVPGTTTAPGDSASYLFKEEVVNDGSVRFIKRTFSQAGLVEQRDESRNNGALLLRTLVHFKSVPSTPSGYTSIGTPVQNPNGFPIYTYTFAKGNGQISREDDTRNNGGLLLATITHLTAPGASDPVATLSGYTRISVTNQEQDGHELWRAVFAQGNGEISRTIDYSQSSDLGTTGITRTVIRHLVAPSASVQPTSLSGSIEIGRDMQDLDGHRVWITTWAKGTGLVGQFIAARQDGLREVTNISLGTKSSPSGVVIRDDYREQDGFRVYTVTAMQEADGGGTVTSATISFERYVPFTYPGRAKAWVETTGGKSFLDVFLSPPVDTLVQATVTVTYTTSNSLGTISDFWNPTEYATMQATWVGAYGVAAARVQSYKGYRTVSATPVTLTGTGYDEAIFGFNIYNGGVGKITVTGGPGDPGGTTKTLSAEIEPAFTSVSGTVYYRKTIVTAAIPAQSALPV